MLHGLFSFLIFAMAATRAHAEPLPKMEGPQIVAAILAEHGDETAVKQWRAHANGLGLDLVAPSAVTVYQGDRDSTVISPRLVGYRASTGELGGQGELILLTWQSRELWKAKAPNGNVLYEWFEETSSQLKVKYFWDHRHRTYIFDIDGFEGSVKKVRAFPQGISSTGGG